MNSCEKTPTPYDGRFDGAPSLHGGMKAIGGYFGFEGGEARAPVTGVMLNSGRNALRWILRELKIKKVHLPFYTCPVVEQAVGEEGCTVVHYPLGKDFLPAVDFAPDDWVVYNNYFGVCGNKVIDFAKRHPNLIVDNAQAFYFQPAGRAAFYSPRKSFGLPDGGIAVIPGREEIVVNLESDHSLGRLAHLFRRLEDGPEAGYAEFQEADSQLLGAPIRAMSATTRALLGCCDFQGAAARRRANFAFLHERLHSSFPFVLSEDDVPMTYPYVSEDSTLRARLISKRIFVPLYWPNTPHHACPVRNLLPLPIDQRYDEEDMRRIIDVILK